MLDVETDVLYHEKKVCFLNQTLFLNKSDMDIGVY